MSAVLFRCFGAQEPMPRRRIDRSMIGNPTNFVHTAHIGSSDVNNGSSNMSSVQDQMHTKGGYGQSSTSGCLSHLKLTDIQTSQGS